MERIQKDVDALKRIAEALIDRMEALERAAGIEKGAGIGITVSKSTQTNTWPVDAMLSRLEKGTKPIEKSTGAGVLSERIADIRKRN
jgi:hypothetical protein